MNYSALIGNPVEHSISPYLFGYLSKIAKLEYSHIKIKVEDKRDLSATFSSLANLKFVGFNITLPYKTDCLSYLDNQDESVRQSGAVNTVKIQNGKFSGFNTDCFGAIHSINTHLKKVEVIDRFLILGAGGAAKAVIYEISKVNSNIWIAARDQSEMDFFVGKYPEQIRGCVGLGDLELENLILKQDINFIINTTPLGMSPNKDVSVLSENVFSKLEQNGFFNKEKYFFDAVFNPFETKLLTLAAKKGAKTCSGLYWMIYQGIKAFEIWNNIKIDQKEINIEDIINFLRKHYV
jgi:shikimate dehydrogenase